MGIDPNHIVVALNVLLTILLLMFLKRRNRATTRLIVLTAVVSLGWLTLYTTLQAEGRLLSAKMNGVTYFGVILATVAVFAVLMLATPLREALRSLSPEYLLIPQGLRAFYGAVFISEAGLGRMPVEAGIFHGSMHVVTGVLCLVAAICWLNHWNWRAMVLFANAFGLVDILTTAWGLSFTSFEQMGPLHDMNYAVFWPAPIFFWLHFFSIESVLKADAKRPAATGALEN